MSDFVKVSTQRIHQDKEDILKELNGIGSDIEGLYQEMQALGQTWEGEAWQVFQKQMADDIENMRSVNEKLSVYIRHIEYAEQEYLKCEGNVARLIDSIRV